MGTIPRELTITTENPGFESYYYRYHISLTGETQGKWNSVSDSATNVLLLDEQGDDLTQTDPKLGVHCCSGLNVADVPTSFSDWGGMTLDVVNNFAEESAVMGLSGNVKVVDSILNCGGSGNFGGCTSTGNDNMMVISDCTGQILAHEHGHTAGLHHNDATTTTDDDHSNNLMTPVAGDSNGITASFQRDAIYSH